MAVDAMPLTITIVSLAETHQKCPRCFRYVRELLPVWAEKGYPPICERCATVIYDLEHPRG